MAEILFSYATFYNIPREIFFEFQGDRFHLSSLYDDVLGDYSDYYEIYRVLFPDISDPILLPTTIDFKGNPAEYIYVGNIKTDEIQFDETHRIQFVSEKLQTILQSASLQFELSSAEYLAQQTEQVHDGREEVSRIAAFTPGSAYLRSFIINVDELCVLLSAKPSELNSRSEPILWYDIYNVPLAALLPFPGLHTADKNWAGRIGIDEIMFDRTLKRFVRTDRLRSCLIGRLPSAVNAEPTAVMKGPNALPAEFRDTFDILDFDGRRMEKRICFFRSDLALSSQIVVAYDVHGNEESETVTLFDELGERSCELFRGLNQHYLRRYTFENSSTNVRKITAYDSHGNQVSV